MNNNVLTGQVALITGAARRIGAEIARVLHADGINVAIHCNNSERQAAELAQALNHQRPDSAIVLSATFGGSDAEKTLIQQAVARWGRLDLLVNNASQFFRTPLLSATQSDWDNLMNSNLRAPFFLAQAAAPYLAKQQGSIINITDTHAERPLQDYSIYCVTKAGLVMLTKVLAKELGPEIRVNAIAPGSIAWPEGKNTLSDEDKQKIIKRTALQKAGECQDIAKAVRFFMRDASYITGQTLIVDGGRVLFG